jgi:DNA-binding NarL/FixJ family response regulator
MDDPVRVFVVDDDSKLLAVWKRFLSKRPAAECVGTSLGEAALAQIIIEANAQVVILDLSIPDVDPLDVISELANATPPVRVLVYSGRSDIGLRQSLEQAGAWGFADKLENPHAILERIRLIADGKKAF